MGRKVRFSCLFGGFLWRSSLAATPPRESKRLSLFFVSKPDSPYYQSQAFGKVIAYMMKYTRRCDLREQNNKRSMLVKDVKTVEEAVCVLQEVVAMQVEE